MGVRSAWPVMPSSPERPSAQPQQRVQRMRDKRKRQIDRSQAAGGPLSTSTPTAATAAAAGARRKPVTKQPFLRRRSRRVALTNPTPHIANVDTKVQSRIKRSETGSFTRSPLRSRHPAAETRKHVAARLWPPKTEALPQMNLQELNSDAAMPPRMEPGPEEEHELRREALAHLDAQLAALREDYYA